jgi:hypothetical protein
MILILWKIATHNFFSFFLMLNFDEFLIFNFLGLMDLFRHRWTGRYEAHLWDNSCRKEGQTRKGRQGERKLFDSISFEFLIIYLF